MKVGDLVTLKTRKTDPPQERFDGIIVNMKVGDLVRFQKVWIVATGIVVETGLFSGNRDIKVMWDDGTIFTERSSSLEVINESR